MFALWRYHPTRLTGRKEEAGRDSIIARMDNLDFFEENVRLWGKDAAVRWLMRQNGWSLATARAAIRLHKQLHATEYELASWQAY